MQLLYFMPFNILTLSIVFVSQPCGHLFHGACVKGSIQNAVGGAPCCPIDGQTMISCILAVPENGSANE